MTLEQKSGNEIYLPPLDRHDHPDNHACFWDDLELRTIREYATRAVIDDRRRRADEVERLLTALGACCAALSECQTCAEPDCALEQRASINTALAAAHGVAGGGAGERSGAAVGGG